MQRTLLCPTVLIAAMMTGVASAQTVPPSPSDPERRWSAHLERIQAFTPRVYATPRGRGFNIAIIDTGVRADHIEFSGGRLIGGFDAFTGRTGVSAASDTNGHGTHVAAIAAGRQDGRGMMGAAPNAGILAVRVFQGATTTDSVIARGIDYANTQNAFAYNLSLGGPGAMPATRAALQRAVSANRLIVIAAGNEGQANPSWPARYATESFANSQIIAVGAVDERNVIARFSNRAGDARNFFLVAPGTNVIAAYATSPSSYAYMSGTSMAAPVVSGAATVVKSFWPYLSARNVAEVLFASATDLGAPGIDAIYGRGLLNLDRALQPIGQQVVMTPTGAQTFIFIPTQFGAARGSWVRAARDGAFVGAVFDDFGRDFQTDFGADLAEHKPEGLSDMTSRLTDRFADRERVVRMGDAVVRFAGQPLDAGHLWLSEGEEMRPNVSMLSLQPNGSALAFAAGRPSPLMGVQSLAPEHGPRIEGLGFVTQDAVLAGERMNYAARLHLISNWHVAFGAEKITDDRTPATLLPTYEVARPAQSYEVEAAWLGERAAFGLGFTALSEEESRLGDAAELVRFNGAARTYSMDAQGAYAVSPRFSLGATMTLAVTEAQDGAQASIARAVSTTTSVGVAVGAAGENLWARNDRLEASLGSPFTTTDGEIDTAFAIAADPETGAPIYRAQRIGLGADTPELRFELSYVRPVSARGKVGLALMNRANADGVAGSVEQAIAAQYRLGF